MNTRDEGKASLVDFLRSIKFAHENRAAQSQSNECPTHFANLKPIAKDAADNNTEDQQLIRSAN